MDQSNETHQPPPPEASPVLWQGMKKAQAPIQRFLQLESAGGYVLAAAALIALAWANLSHETYESFWHTEIGFVGHGREFVRPLHFWVNDVLMSVFFLLAGLEIKRQMVEGELSTPRRAALPIVAALGGMMVPALIYFAFNPTGTAMRGTAIPVATDIAFAVGVITLLGNRVPAALKILLLTLAVADDIGGIIVIALFYNSGVAWTGLAVAVAGAGTFWLLRSIGKRPGWVYYSPLIVVWMGLNEAGIHPTLSGVVIGLMIPAKAWKTPKAFAASALEESKTIHLRTQHEMGPEEEKEVSTRILSLSHEASEALTPLARLEHAIQPLVVFGIMPVFALANAGVYLGGGTLDALDLHVGLGIGIGLVVGKPVGVLLATWVSTKLGVCQLPRGVNAKGIALVGILAGIGFTVSNFIALLSFTDPVLIASAKLSILVGSGVSTVAGLAYGRWMFRVPSERNDIAATLVAAESSDEV
ncbi:Na+/H+ antiporter NhaA [Candidatus Uhrbacteria bacterium]|nr:Na+/H+ antiporter NhaA [Candidatus Uhrbacteria bacterium]